MLVPVGTAWADIYGGLKRDVGPFIHAEIGAHPWQRVGVYGFGEASRVDVAAGLGVRFEVDW